MFNSNLIIISLLFGFLAGFLIFYLFEIEFDILPKLLEIKDDVKDIKFYAQRIFENTLNLDRDMISIKRKLKGRLK